MMAHGDALKKIEQVLPDAFKGAAPAPVFEFSRRFSFTHPERDHSIGDTIKFAQSLAAKTWADPDQQRQAILRYVTAFAQTSKVMQTLDEACPPIMRGRPKLPGSPESEISRRYCRPRRNARCVLRSAVTSAMKR